METGMVPPDRIELSTSALPKFGRKAKNPYKNKILRSRVIESPDFPQGSGSHV
jgi:hypothetical protein